MFHARLRRAAGLVALTAAAAALTAVPPAQAHTVSSANPNASSAARSTLNWLAHLPSPANANGGGLNTPMANFADLLNFSTAAGARWRALMDKTAQGLQDLENAGVPVLFRPFHEVNGDWFWWGNRDANAFKQVWQQLYTYSSTPTAPPPPAASHRAGRLR